MREFRTLRAKDKLDITKISLGDYTKRLREATAELQDAREEMLDVLATLVSAGANTAQANEALFDLIGALVTVRDVTDFMERLHKEL